MFADDPKIWAKVKDLPDTTSFQRDLDTVGNMDRKADVA